MAFTCHITYRDSKKIVRFSDSVPSVIVAEINTAFGLTSGRSSSNIKLQKFEEEWNDWVDISISELQHGMKIKILDSDDPSVTQSPVLERTHSAGSASTVLIDDSSCDESFDQLGPIFDLSSPQCSGTFIYKLSGECATPVTTSSSCSSLSSPTTSASSLPTPTTSSSLDEKSDVESKENDEVQEEVTAILPKNFQVNLPKKLVQKLNSGCFPNERERRQIVSYTFNDMANFLVYPTSEQYNQVASSLVERFPLLAEGTFSTTPYHYWKTRLMDKYRNERRNLVFPKNRKLKKSSAFTTEPECASKTANDCGLPEGEDAASQLRHQKWLQEESKRRKPDVQKASLLMDKTFFTRRQDVINHPEKLYLWREKYPFLFDSEELLKEFSRITQRNCKGEVKKAILQYVKILDEADEDVISMYQQEVSKAKGDDDLNDLRCVATLVTLPKMLKERIGNFIVLEDEGASDKPLTSESVIFATGPSYFNISNIYIKTEDEVVCEPASLLEAFECLMAVYYTFNLSFPTKSKNFLTFLDLLLGLKSKRIPRSIVTFMTKFKSLQDDCI